MKQLKNLKKKTIGFDEHEINWTLMYVYVCETRKFLNCEGFFFSWTTLKTDGNILCVKLAVVVFSRLVAKMWGSLGGVYEGKREIY